MNFAFPSTVESQKLAPKTKMPGIGLRGRFLMIVVAAMLPALMLALVNVTEQRREAISNFTNDAVKTATQFTEIHQRLIDGATRLARDLIQLTSVGTGNNSEDCEDIITELTRGYGNYQDVQIAKITGEVFCRLQHHSKPANLAERPYFQEALSTREVAISGFVSGQLYVAFPAFDSDNTLESVIVIDMELDWIDKLVARSGFSADSIITIVDRSGIILAQHPGPKSSVTMTLTEWLGHEQERDLASTKIFEAPDANGITRLFVVEPIHTSTPIPSSFLIVGIPVDAVFSNIESRYLRTIAVLLIIGIAAALAAWMVATTWIARPVQALLRATSQLASGNLDLRIGPPYASGELGQLASAFDDMAETLRERDQALAQNRNLLDSIVNALPVGLSVKDRDGHFTFVNRYMEKFLGQPPENILGKTSVEVFGPDLGRKYTALDQKIIESGQPILNYEDHFKLEGSVETTRLINKVPQMNEAGEAVSVISISVDITERRKAERTIADSEALLRALMDHSPTKIHVKDTSGRYLFINQKAQALFNVTKNQALEKTSADIFSPSMAAKFADHDREVIQSRSAVEREEVFDTKHGVRTFLTTKFPVLDAKGELRGVGAIGTDITERKQTMAALDESRKLLRSLLDALPMCVNVKDKAGRYIVMNRFEADFIGQPADAVIGKTAVEVYGEETGREVEEWDRRIIDTEEQIPYFEHSYESADGTKSIWMTTKIPLMNPDGDVQGVITIGLDITDRKSAEIQLQRAQKFDAIGQLTSGIAHDFNNLLTIILGNLQLLERTLADNPRQQHKVRVAIDATTRGANLTQRLLAFARKQVLEPGVIDVSRLVAGMSELMERSLGKVISVDVSLDEDLWSIWADAGQLENVLLNLAVNARDAMPGGGVLIIRGKNHRVDEDEAAGHPGLSAGDYVALEVSDNGCGMDSETLAHALDPFFTTKDVGKGTGLGLAMVYGFIKQSGGYISVYSEPGHGTTVRLYLLRNKRAELEGLAPVEVPKDIPTGNETILVAEDDAGVREVAISILEGLGYRVLSAASGQEALSTLANRGDVDLLFTDMVMGGEMGGGQLIEEARKLYPAMKVVIASGFTSDLLNSRKNILRNAHFIQKPYRRGKLARFIRKALDEMELVS